MFRNAFSSRCARRYADFSTMILATEDSDNTGFHRRWLHDFSGDFLDSGIGGNFRHLGRTSHIASEQHWHSRSQVLNEIHHQPSFSLPMVSRPARESFVESLPLKPYKKPNSVENRDDIEQ
ncbi:hypothetical protein Nepgr_020829 [Nepenthes gracilis]|uniref:Uncharacterized protein n=1 Tax=Nepenthes gracilis TaxID=150966 RepID=A0AAD3XVK5_NEPGR|nr:hypothetical protein Nepgr_020829 [Nepenthes gracilis]